MRVLEQALELATFRVIGAINGDAIVRDHLKPAFEATLEAVRKAAPKLAGLDVTQSEAFLDAPAPVRAAFSELRAASARYNSLRAAQRACHTLAGGTRDGAGSFAQVRNVRQLYGDRWQGHLQSSWTPWPDHALSYLLWIVNSPAEPWLPTVEEVNQAVEELQAARPRTVVGAGF